ncbi:MAG TPA: DNA mismatch repair protein MutS [Candidatus Babeliales bacterium]|nr:DNA mismatch repair protein MutS [Candidatus Babeliales bacterium]
MTHTVHTPLMQQYHDIKAQYTDALLLFQVGDFYELFYDDAKQAAAFLGIALTSRGKDGNNPIPLCGVPVHTKDHYVAKLVKGGFNVALCDQLEPATPGVVVARGVTQVLTPGTLVDGILLDEKKSSYLFSCFPTVDNCGLLFGELLSAQLFATALPTHAERNLEGEVQRFFPDEVLLPSTQLGKQYAQRFKQWGYHITIIDIQETVPVTLDGWIKEQFGADIWNLFGHYSALKQAFYSFYNYIQRNQRTAINQFRTVNFYKPDEYLLLDAATQRNLELTKNNYDKSSKNSLFSILDHAQTAMGSRVLRNWITRPRVDYETIVQRQDCIALCIHQPSLMHHLPSLLTSVGDIERVVGRIGLDRAPLHDYVHLKQALHTIPHIADILQAHTHLELIHTTVALCQSFAPVANILDRAINDDETKPWLIKKGFDADLDRMRDLVLHSTDKLSELERTEQERTGISSLKIRYNQVHGYYIEITKSNLHMVPNYYMRRQTLVGKERFMIPDLQKLAYDIEHARIDSDEHEKRLFILIKREIAQQVSALRKLAHALSHLDALVSLALVARNNKYVCPSFNTNEQISIIGGRHPVIESLLAERFIPNDTTFDNEQSMLIITGPNMGGKSTYLRQVALICIMAQMGSYVPAQSANLFLLDRIFTRIGAGDYLAEGKSTFLVEMEETATICTQATASSLVILDEVGRGTSTFDGLAIAQAVVEHILLRIGAPCLFATHYHELTKLETEYPGVVSYYAASTKTTNGIVFLYKMVRGTADGSFGIEVGKLAQLPPTIINRAQEILKQLYNQ